MTDGGSAHNEQSATGASVNSVERAVIVTAAVLIGLLAAQPLFITRDPFRQSEFAWEMYSKGAPRDEFVVVSDAGSERLTVTDVQPRGLALVDYTEVLPGFICARRPSTEEVRVYRADELIGTHRCNG
jgi:hypothetical protein